MRAFDPTRTPAKFVVIGTSLKSAAFYPTEAGHIPGGGLSQAPKWPIVSSGPAREHRRNPTVWKVMHVGWKKIAVVMPAYNAELTLGKTVAEIPRDIVDDLILTDDGSSDRTAELARSLGIYTLTHDKNCGYGANQKTCYASALARGADIVVMLHPDYQYSPKLVTAMASMVCSGHYDVVLGPGLLAMMPSKEACRRTSISRTASSRFGRTCF